MSFMSSLKKTTLPNYIVSEASLLETKEVYVIDSLDVVEQLRCLASDLFMAPPHGVYRKNEYKPFIYPGQILYHSNAPFDYFPEVSSSIYCEKTKTIMKESIGRPIDWKQAIENNINVFDKHGNRLLKATDDRNMFFYNPGPEWMALKFFMELAENTMHATTAWGEPVFDEIDYLYPNVSLKEAVRIGFNIASPVLKKIESKIREDIWKIYRVSNFGHHLILESSCDYRHYMCNKQLLEQMSEKERYDRNLMGLESHVLEGYSWEPSAHGVRAKLQIQEIELLLEKIRTTVGHDVRNIQDLDKLFVYCNSGSVDGKNHEEFINRKVTSKKLGKCIEDFLDSRDDKPIIVNTLIRKHNGVYSLDFNQANGINFL